MQVTILSRTILNESEIKALREHEKTSKKRCTHCGGDVKEIIYTGMYMQLARQKIVTFHEVACVVCENNSFVYNDE